MKPILSFLLFVATLFASIPSNIYDTQDHRISKIVEGTATTYLIDTNTPYAQVITESKTDEAGETTRYGYDTDKTIPLLSRVTLANGATTTYTYDSRGRKTAQTDALSRTTSWSYTPTGELSSETLPQGERKSYTYDTQGRLTQITDYAGKAQKFIYNAYNRLVRIEYSDGNTVTYDYTPSGRVKTVTDAQGTIANTYDAMGRLKTRTNASGETITYTYDEAGNITRIETPTQTITKTYDALNRLKSVTDAQGTTTYEYDAIGRQTQITYPSGVSTEYSYDSRNRVTKIVHKKSDGTILQSFAYTYDAVGNRVKVVENTGRTVAYTYNEVNRLTKETVTNDPNGKNTTTTYTYDAVGNLVTKTLNGTSESYTYNANDQLTTKGSITYTYDRNGNLIGDGTNTYEYDDKNRLVKVITPTDTIEYSYDANDNRVAKTTNNGTTTYLVDTNTPYAQVITESKENGTEIHYTYGHDLLSDGSHAFLTDALGSTRALVDRTGQITDTYSYTPYGKLVSHDGTSENSFLFTGEQFDDETQNYYLRARYYSPSSSRFLTRDTYDGRDYEPATLNHYGYAHGNPVNYVDPSGHMTISGAMNTISIQGTLGGIRTGRLALGRKGVFDTLTKGIGLDGKGPVLRSVVDFVVSELTGFDSGTSNPSVSGSKAHAKLAKAIGSYKPLGKWIKLVPEVSLCPLGLPIPYNRFGPIGKPNIRGYNMRIDIQVYFEEKLIFVVDLKTGKSGLSKSKCNKYSQRHGGVPVIEIFLPFD